MANIELGTRHLAEAYAYGANRAKGEQLLEVTAPSEEGLDDTERADLAYTITGYKIDVESDEAFELERHYFDGYYDAWNGGGDND